jgi:hypothetical protein
MATQNSTHSSNTEPLSLADIAAAGPAESIPLSEYERDVAAAEESGLRRGVAFAESQFSEKLEAARRDAALEAVSFTSAACEIGEIDALLEVLSESLCGLSAVGMTQKQKDDVNRLIYLTSSAQRVTDALAVMAGLRESRFGRAA